MPTSASMPSCTGSCHDHLCVTSSPPLPRNTWSAILICPSHTARSSMPSNSAKAAITDIVSLSARVVANNTASITHAATATALSASITKPSSGYTTTWTNSSLGHTSSSPLPFLQPYAPSSAHINASLTRPCSPPRLSPSNGSPKTSGSSVRTCLDLQASCIPGAGNSSITPTCTILSLAADSQKTAWPGDPPEPPSLSP